MVMLAVLENPFLLVCLFVVVAVVLYFSCKVFHASTRKGWFSLGYKHKHKDKQVRTLAA